MRDNQLSHKIIGCAMKVHSELGPGLLESSYEACLYYELKHTGLGVIKQMALPLVYNDVKLEVGYRIDLLVENNSTRHDRNFFTNQIFFKLFWCEPKCYNPRVFFPTSKFF